MITPVDQKKKAQEILTKLEGLNTHYHGIEQPQMGDKCLRIKNAPTSYQLLCSILKNVSLGGDTPNSSDIVAIIIDCGRANENLKKFPLIDLSPVMDDLVSTLCNSPSIPRSR